MTYKTNNALDEEYKNRRNAVERGEHLVAAFLDKYFYPAWSTIVQRYGQDDPLQIAGRDITVLCGSTQVHIDEKATVRWIGKDLCTFAQEINSVNSVGEEYDGWLLDFNSASDYLLEIWIDAVNNEENELNDPEDITDATVVLIKKRDLWRFLKDSGVDSTELRKMASEMRRNEEKNRIYHGFKVVVNNKIRERVANLLIPRRLLIDFISTYAVRIHDKQITELGLRFNN